MTAKTYRHVNKTQSSIQGKALPPSNASHKSAQDSIPVGKGMTVAHVGSAHASRLAAVPHTSSLFAQHVRASTHNSLALHVCCPRRYQDTRKRQPVVKLKHEFPWLFWLLMLCEFCSKAESDDRWKNEREALQGEIQHLRHLVSLASTSSNFLSTSKTCNGVAPRSSLSPILNASQDTPSMVHGLKREELLKWKIAQLERQVTLLQAALQVDPRKDEAYCLSTPISSA